MTKKIILSLLYCFSTLTLAAGPTKVATLDRELWPQSINSAVAFDYASRFEIMQYTIAVALAPSANTAEIQAFTNVNNINLNSINIWFSSTKALLLKNYQTASANCTESSVCRKASDWNSLVTISNETLTRHAASSWASASQSFYQRYLYEQMRLALLFPRISSEISVLAENESTGKEFADREFLLTFDDGPSKGQLTEKLVNALEAYDIHSYFFALGERLEKDPKKLKILYKNQCLGSHGYQHKSHAKWDKWQESLQKTNILINGVGSLAGKTWFRPPYGQRNLELSDYLNKKNAGVMLWNIDSQDWNRKLSAKNIQDRVATLMLLWRHGIILFHDIHPKALASLEGLQQLKQSGELTWLDCRKK